MIVTAGELLSEFVSHRTDCGLEVISDYSGPYPSGAPAIFIDQAALMGAETMIFGTVGNDPFGRALVARLAADGVGVRGIEVSEKLTTGTAFVSYFSNGERTFLFHIRGTATERVSVAQGPTGPFTLHVSGASLGIYEPRSALLTLAELAIAQGGEVTLDPNVRSEMMTDKAASDALSVIISQARIVLPSEADMAFLYPDQTLEQGCQTLLDGGAEIVVLKRDRLGVRVVTRDTEFAVPGHTVEEVDPTGAGDCFCGAFLGLRDQGYDLREAATLANAAGAIHVTQRGPMEKNPTLAEMQAMAKGDAPLDTR